MRPLLFMLLLALFLLGGCQSSQVHRHLASDAALIKPGQTTIQEMQKYLGEPKARRAVAPGVDEWVYYEDRAGFFGNTPVLESITGPSGYEMIIVTVEKERVTHCEFRNFSDSDRGWVEDFTWEEVE